MTLQEWFYAVAIIWMVAGIVIFLAAVILGINIYLKIQNTVDKAAALVSSIKESPVSSIASFIPLIPIAARIWHRLRKNYD